MTGPAAIDWGPAPAVLAAGLAVGVVLVSRLLSARRDTAQASLLDAHDLAGKRDALLRQLAELEDTAPRRTAGQLAQERYALELEAARVLLALEGHRVPAEARPRRRSGVHREAVPRRALLQAGGVALALGLLLFFVGQSAKPRSPGASITGAPGTASRGRRVSGTIEIDPALAQAVDARAVLFVFARSAGAADGPPVAAKRLPAVFPAAFELGEADTMLGQPLPDALLVEARLDSDGDPTTRAAGDPRARLDQVEAGRSDLRLVLRR